MNNTSRVFLFTSSFLILLAGCQCKKEEENPCPSNLPDGSFTVYDFVESNILLEWTTSDSQSNGSNYRFYSNFEYNKYEWIIGLDPKRQYGQWAEVREFRNDPGKPYSTITFIGQRNPIPDCIENDDGIDTFTRKIYMVDDYFFPWPGYYQGSFDSHPGDTFTIALIRYYDTLDRREFTYLSNFPKGYFSRTGNNFHSFIRWFRTTGFVANYSSRPCNYNFDNLPEFDTVNSFCNVRDITAKLLPDGSGIEVNASLVGYLLPPRAVKFTGRRIK